MGKIGFFFSLLLLGAGPAWAQQATPPDPASQKAAADYLSRFEKSYSAALSSQPPLPPTTPPVDVVALMEAAPVLQQSIDSCVRESKDTAALILCELTPYRSLAAAAALRDGALSQAFETTAGEIVADLGSHKLAEAPARAAFEALAGEYMGASRGEFEDWLYLQGRKIDGAPFEAGAVAEASADAGRAANVCTLGRKNASDFVDCLIDDDRAFDKQVKMADTTALALESDILKRAAAESDAGRLPFETLLKLYGTLRQSYVNVATRHYADYAVALYKARFAALYGKTNGAPASFDQNAAEAAAPALVAAVRRCGDAPAGNQTVSGWVACRLAAMKTFNDTIDISDTALYPAIAQTLSEAATDADSGRTLPAAMPAVMEAFANIYGDRMDGKTAVP